jgi:hypothetical protein
MHCALACVFTHEREARVSGYCTTGMGTIVSQNCNPYPAHTRTHAIAYGPGPLLMSSTCSSDGTTRACVVQSLLHTLVLPPSHPHPQGIPSSPSSLGPSPSPPSSSSCFPCFPPIPLRLPSSPSPSPCSDDAIRTCVVRSLLHALTHPLWTWNFIPNLYHPW